MYEHGPGNLPTIAHHNQIFSTSLRWAGGTFPDESVFIDSGGVFPHRINQRTLRLPHPPSLMPYFKPFRQATKQSCTSGCHRAGTQSRRPTSPCSAVSSQKKPMHNVAITIGIVFERIIKHRPEVMTKHTDFSTELKLYAIRERTKGVCSCDDSDSSFQPAYEHNVVMPF